ncbi:MAG: thioredoxin family protein [Gemmatimonadetes bacterium]|nr:thioredoxin family protein [Gemmatimonadota bacterium]
MRLLVASLLSLGALRPAHAVIAPCGTTIDLAVASVSMPTDLAFRPVAPPAAVTDSTPADLFAGGMTFGDFVGRMGGRKDEWLKRNDWGRIPDEAAQRLRAIATPLRILVVAEEGCSDSMNSIPYLVRLVALAPDIQLRVVNSSTGRSIMEAHRTPDGRAATPTVVVLDAKGTTVACWIERPATLRQWMKTPKDSLPSDQRFGGRLAWYEHDKGASAMAEWVPMLEAAAAGRTSCPD